jgi:Flp pilus assembly pilin Flp
MLNFIKNFRNDENGAVTVDWVVLTAAVVGLAVGAYTALDTNISALATGAATTMPTF